MAADNKQDGKKAGVKEEEEKKHPEAPDIAPGAIEKVLPGDEDSSALDKAARIPEHPKDEKDN